MPNYMRSNCKKKVLYTKLLACEHLGCVIPVSTVNKYHVIRGMMKSFIHSNIIPIANTVLQSYSSRHHSYSSWWICFSRHGSVSHVISDTGNSHDETCINVETHPWTITPTSLNIYQYRLGSHDNPA